MSKATGTDTLVCILIGQDCRRWNRALSVTGHGKPVFDTGGRVIAVWLLL